MGGLNPWSEPLFLAVAESLGLRPVDRSRRHHLEQASHFFRIGQPMMRSPYGVGLFRARRHQRRGALIDAERLQPLALFGRPVHGQHARSGNIGERMKIDMGGKV